MAHKKMLSPRPSCVSGLSLIEQLMILFVLALLVRLALPIYRNYVNRPIVKAAQQDLVRMAAALQTNRFETSLTLPTTAGYVNVPALAASRNVGTQATDFAGWQPTQSAKFNYSASSTSNSTAMAFAVRASSMSAGILPLTCWMDLSWSADLGTYVRSADASCGFTSW